MVRSWRWGREKTSARLGSRVEKTWRIEEAQTLLTAETIELFGAHLTV
jgi:hypothetical protein